MKDMLLKIMLHTYVLYVRGAVKFKPESPFFELTVHWRINIMK